MKEIQKFDISKLRYEEDFNFLKKVLIEASLYLNSEGDKAMVESFENAVNAFDEVLSLSSTNPFSQDVRDTVEKADILWRGMRNHLKGVIAFPNEVKSAIAQKAINLVGKYGDITQMSQGEKFGSLDNLTSDLLMITKPELHSIGLDEWVEELVNVSNDYLNTYSSFTEEEVKHEKGIAKQRRCEADDAFKLLSKRVNAKSITFEDGRHDTFIDNVNFLISKEKTKIAIRRTRAENQRAEDKDGSDLPTE